MVLRQVNGIETAAIYNNTITFQDFKRQSTVYKQYRGYASCFLKFKVTCIYMKFRSLDHLRKAQGKLL